MRALCRDSLAGPILLAAVVAAAQPTAAGATFAQTRPGPPAPSGSPRDDSAAEKATARIRGRVVSGQTGKPVRRAQVRIFVNKTRLTRFATTDADGRYEFSALPAGRYSVHVTKAGYVSSGPQGGAEGGGKLFDLADGQLADRVDFVLARGGVIIGRITDESGEPLTGAEVQALRFQFRPDGQRQLAPRDTGNQMSFTTNDLGEFRVFGLMAGNYVVLATVPDAAVLDARQAAADGTSGMTKIDGPVTTYYPGTASPAESQAVMVDPKQEASASFALVSSRLSRVSGTVRDSEGRPASGSWVSIRSRDEGHVRYIVRERRRSRGIGGRKLLAGERPSGRVHARGTVEARQVGRIIPRRIRQRPDRGHRRSRFVGRHLDVAWNRRIRQGHLRREAAAGQCRRAQNRCRAGRSGEKRRRGIGPLHRRHRCKREVRDSQCVRSCALSADEFSSALAAQVGETERRRDR